MITLHVLDARHVGAEKPEPLAVLRVPAYPPATTSTALCHQEREFMFELWGDSFFYPGGDHKYTEVWVKESWASRHRNGMT